MKHYEMVDLFIAETCDGNGSTFRSRDLQDWLDINAVDEFGDPPRATTVLDAHRNATILAPSGKVRKGGNRIFTTMRHGMGKHSYYEVVESEPGVIPTALLEMHTQQTQEMISRWEQEARTRMHPLLKRHKRARREFNKAAHQMKLVAVSLDKQLSAYVEEMIEESEA